MFIEMDCICILIYNFNYGTILRIHLKGVAFCQSIGIKSRSSAFSLVKIYSFK